MTLANVIGIAYLVVGLATATGLYAVIQGDLRIRGRRDTDTDLDRAADAITDTVRRGLQSPRRWQVATLIAVYLAVVVAAWPVAVAYVIVMDRIERGRS